MRKRITRLVAAAVMIMLFFGCAKNKRVDLSKLQGETLLIDYYRATVATVGGDGYTELALYYTDGAFELRRYEKENPEAEETVEVFAAPAAAYDECMAVIDECGFRGWKAGEGIGIAGALYVVKFRDGDNYVRVSSEDMPEDGVEKLRRVGEALGKYANN